MTRFPTDAQLELHSDVRTGADGWLVGGSPTRLLHLVPGTLRDGLRLGGTLAPDPVGERLVHSGFAWFRAGSLPEIAHRDVTVVVPARTSPMALQRLLQGLTGLTTVVVDDQSPVPLDSVAARYGAHCVRLDTNLGPAAARNIGYAATSSRYVVFCDADTVVTTADVMALVQHLSYEQVAAAAPRVAAAPVENPTWVSRYETAMSSLDMGARSGLVRAGSRIGWVPSAVLAVRRDAAGPTPFESALRTGEDVDLVWRLDADGWLVYYDASVVVQHIPRTTPLAWAQRKFVYGLSAGPLYRRHGRSVAPARLGRLQLLATAALMLGKPATATVLLIGQNLHLRRRLRHSDLDPNLFAPIERTVALNTLRQASQLGLGVWSPLLLWSRGGRRFLILAAAIEGLLLWSTNRPQLGPLEFTIARRVDDAAYALGVWVGAVRVRTLGPLLPTTPG